MSKIINTYRRFRLRQKTANQLYSMSDRDLSDIGLCRGNIRALVDAI